eukprot:scaffold4621_cov128-Isochrysis_galbana.AAC.4
MREGGKGGARGPEGTSPRARALSGGGGVIRYQWTGGGAVDYLQPARAGGGAAVCCVRPRDLGHDTCYAAATWAPVHLGSIGPSPPVPDSKHDRLRLHTSASLPGGSLIPRAKSPRVCARRGTRPCTARPSRPSRRHRRASPRPGSARPLEAVQGWPARCATLATRRWRSCCCPTGTTARLHPALRTATPTNVGGAPPPTHSRRAPPRATRKRRARRRWPAVALRSRSSAEASSRDRRERSVWPREGPEPVKRVPVAVRGPAHRLLLPRELHVGPKLVSALDLDATHDQLPVGRRRHTHHPCGCRRGPGRPAHWHHPAREGGERRVTHRPHQRQELGERNGRRTVSLYHTAEAAHLHLELEINGCAFGGLHALVGGGYCGEWSGPCQLGCGSRDVARLGAPAYKDLDAPVAIVEA